MRADQAVLVQGLLLFLCLFVRFVEGPGAHRRHAWWQLGLQSTKVESHIELWLASQGRVNLGRLCPKTLEN